VRPCRRQLFSPDNAPWSTRWPRASGPDCPPGQRRKSPCYAANAGIASRAPASGRPNSIQRSKAGNARLFPPLALDPPNSFSGLTAIAQRPTDSDGRCSPKPGSPRPWTSRRGNVWVGILQPPGNNPDVLGRLAVPPGKKAAHRGPWPERNAASVPNLCTTPLLVPHEPHLMINTYRPLQSQATGSHDLGPVGPLAVGKPTRPLTSSRRSWSCGRISRNGRGAGADRPPTVPSRRQRREGVICHAHL